MYEDLKYRCGSEDDLFDASWKSCGGKDERICPTYQIIEPDVYEGLLDWQVVAYKYCAS